MRFFLASVLLLAATSVQAAPKLEHLSPLGAQRGTQATISAQGSGLQDVTALWFANPAIQATLQPGGKADEQKFQVTVPANVAPGLVECRAIGKDGISDARFLVVGTLPEITKKDERTTQFEPQDVTLPVTVNGMIKDNNQADWFRFSLKKGEWITVLCTGRWSGAKLDPYVRLLDPQGRSLGWSDDSGASTDARLHFQAPEDGQYIVEARDVQYRGGKGFDYRLKLWTGPFVTGAMPAAIQSGHPQTVQARVSGENRAVSVSPLPERDWDGPGAWVTIPGAPEPYPLLASDYPQLDGRAPNDPPEQAQALSLPCGVTGTFGSIADIDRYRVSLKAGQSLVVRVRMNNWQGQGSPTVSLFAPDGKLLHDERGNGDGEATATLTAKVGGEYRIELHALLWKVRGGPEFTYNAEFSEKESPDIGVSFPAGVTTYEEETGKEVKIKLNVERRAFDGPIALDVEGLPAGCTFEPKSTPGKGFVELTAKCPAPVPVSHALLRVTAKAEVAGAMRSRLGHGAARVFQQDPDVADTAPEVTHLGLNIGPAK